LSGLLFYCQKSVDKWKKNTYIYLKEFLVKYTNIYEYAYKGSKESNRKEFR